MRILHTVQLYEPRKGGSEEVVKQISERLAARGHKVTVATAADPRRTWTTLNGVEVRSFEVSGNAVLGIKGDAEGYRRFLRGADVDVMLNYAPQTWCTDIAFDLLDELRCRKVLVPCGLSGLKWPEFASYFADLPRHLKRYDALVYMSENYQDKRFGDEHGLGDKAVIIPNGAAAEEFDAETPPFRERFGITTPLMVLTVANHYEAKGHRRLVEAFKSLRREDATLVLIGNRVEHWWHGCFAWCRTQSLVNPRIKVLEGVPRPLVVSAYKEADVFALASEIECAPLVIYEAMAAGIPFVSTNCGNVKDNAPAGIVVDDPDDLGGALAELLDDPERRRRLGESGRASWRAAHTWEVIVDAYESLYERLIEERP